ncbi:MAG: transcriptional regulator [Hyphomicrobiales bacterium]|nr:transcriptional regulator [Hyphomicrobiales bacterium]MBV8444165.1 transcriptional regulator [Hyphomicrobiales bacterium]
MPKDLDPRLNPTPREARLEDALRPLVDSLRSLLATAEPEAQPFLRDWPAMLIARPQTARSLPVVSALEGLSRFAAPHTRTLVEAIAAMAEDTDWRQTYTRADFGERFLQNYGWSEWVGRRGMFESDAIACGVLLLGPDIEYPAHSHEAEELYLPLAGHAWWRSGQSDWRLRPPGQWIHHPSWTTHAVRTAAEPLLAAYVWRAGDLTAKSRIGR